MGKYVRDRGTKGTGRKGPGTPKHPDKGADRPDDRMTVREIVREFGGTPEQWAELIRSGKLNGTRYRVTPGIRVRRKLVLAYVTRAVSHALAADAPSQRKASPPLPRIVFRNKVALIEETSIRVRRLERAWRAGSTEADLCAAFPDLPPGSLKAVAVFARKYPANTKALEDLLAPAQASPGEQDDDSAGFDAELEGLIQTHAGLFRRLAQ